MLPHFLKFIELFEGIPAPKRFFLKKSCTCVNMEVVTQSFVHVDFVIPKPFYFNALNLTLLYYQFEAFNLNYWSFLFWTPKHFVLYCLIVT